MLLPGDYSLGVIEGFFGRPWDWDSRMRYAGFLAEQGYTSYIYAPKGDAFLRKRWQEDFPQQHLDALTTLCHHYRQAGIDFGIGLSPFELYRDFSAAPKQQLLRKLDAINAIGPSILCILFDDMTGDLDSLAGLQTEIMDLVCAHSSARHFLLCPTYYSSDPRLARLFGTPPENYLEELGLALDQTIGMFWTGPQIISAAYPRPHLEEVARRMRRKPVLWDNYPVNDARNLTDFLHLLPFASHDSAMAELCSGHFSNPMNQAALSQLPLYSLPRLYAGSTASSEALFHEACSSLCSPGLAAALLQDAVKFQCEGLTALDEKSKTELIGLYAAFSQEPMAKEVIAWLQGSYAFDPACLT
jgi:hyaluronoglucosaminidase